MDSKGQDILFNSEMNQKDLMIQMLSERLDEKDETITELKETCLLYTSDAADEL